MEYYSPIEKKKISPFTTEWIDLDSIMLSEISQSEKEKYINLIHMWNLRNKIK